MTARETTRISALPSVPLSTPARDIIPGVPVCLAAGTGPWIVETGSNSGYGLDPRNVIGAPQDASGEYPANEEIYKEAVVCLPRGWIGFGGMLEFRAAGIYTISDSPVAGGTGWFQFVLDPLSTSATALSAAVGSIAYTAPYVPVSGTLDGRWSLSMRMRATAPDVQLYDGSLRVWNALALESTDAAGTGSTPLVHQESGTVDLVESTTHWRWLFAKTGAVAGESLQVDWFQVVLHPGQRIA